MTQNKSHHLGFGLGLRPEHYQAITTQSISVDWLEILTENYLVPGGKPLYFLDKVAERFPLAMHGVSLSIGSSDPIDWQYLHQVKQLAQRIKATWISDHLCWTGINGVNMHDLLPLPYTEEALEHVATRVIKVQDYLQEPLVLENVSSYITYPESTLTEAEFLHELYKLTGCKILLDINNIIVSAHNHNQNPKAFIDTIPPEAIQQIHLAGHSTQGDIKIDTHDAPVPNSVWELYHYTIEKHGDISTMIERDDNIPKIEALVDEICMARNIAQLAKQGKHAA